MQNDPTVKQRERAIQSLELAHHKCEEIQGNLAEGTTGYVVPPVLYRTET